MSYNKHHADAVRESTFGIDMRDPIVKGCTIGDRALESVRQHSAAQMNQFIYESENDLDRKLHAEQDILDHAVNSGNYTLNNASDEAHSRLELVDEKCDTRIYSMSVTKLAGNNEYYKLSFIRANGM